MKSAKPIFTFILIIILVFFIPYPERGFSIESKAKYLILKLGEKGILVFRKPSEKPRDFIFIDSFAEELVDALGAGDAMLSATSLAYKCSKNIFISAIIGSFAAAVACEKEGNIPISIGEIEKKVKRIKDYKFV